MDQGSKAGVGAGAGEVRKVHIVYFLSHDGGKIEQPHLLRVHHLHRNGVHLRDVKRWLSDVRGKDMPDSYAWSYKRRYKSGYVWQDLKDDELITPFSDNEYIIKGSEISWKNNEASAVEEGALSSEVVPTPKTPRRSLLRRLEVCEVTSPKAPSPPEQESPGAARPPPPSVSDASDESGERAAEVRIDLWKRVQDRRHSKLRADEAAAVSSARHRTRSDSGGGGGSWWPGRKTSSLLRNLLTCGAVETSNSALTVQRSKKDVPIDSDTTCADSTNSRQCGKSFRSHPHKKSYNASETRGRKSIDKRKVVEKN